VWLTLAFPRLQNTCYHTDKKLAGHARVLEYDAWKAFSESSSLVWAHCSVDRNA